MKKYIQSKMGINCYIYRKYECNESPYALNLQKGICENMHVSTVLQRKANVQYHYSRAQIY
jgi:hypothetical protein